MADYDRSLDDLIKKRRLFTKKWSGSGGNYTTTTKSKQTNQRKKIPTVPPRVDARERIMQKRLTTMADAREKLSRRKAPLSPAAVTDARQKLNAIVAQKRQRQQQTKLPDKKKSAGISLTRTIKNRGTPVLLNRLARISNRKETSNVDDKRVLLTRSGLTVIRKSTTGSREDQAASVAPQASLFARTVSSLAKETGHFGDLQSTKMTSVVDRASMNSALQSRLARLEDATKDQYKVTVSNLHPNVTLEDIMELFGDVGPLRKVELKKPGMAEVIFAKLADAKQAVDNYNNRELDGQPMICKVTSSPAVSESSYISALRGVGTLHSDRMSPPPSVKTRITPDVGVIHKALFSSSGRRSQAYAPLNNSKASVTVTM